MLPGEKGDGKAYVNYDITYRNHCWSPAKNLDKAALKLYELTNGQLLVLVLFSN